jgi:hypothetical protein
MVKSVKAVFDGPEWQAQASFVIDGRLRTAWERIEDYGRLREGS